jgi:hypothetical protein
MQLEAAEIFMVALRYKIFQRDFKASWWPFRSGKQFL